MAQWIPFYIGDYDRDTKDLTLVEHGAYLKLLMHCWATGQPLPLEEHVIFRIASAFTPEEQNAVRKILTKFFTQKSTGFFNKKAQEIIKRQDEIRAKNSQNAKKRWDATASDSQCDRISQNDADPEPEPDPNIKPEPHPTGPKNKFSDADMATAKFIFEKVRRLNAGMKEPNFPSWANTIRKMREIDTRTDLQVRELFTWANEDPFWQSNILSPEKLREKFDQLVLRRNSAVTRPSRPQGSMLAGNNIVPAEQREGRSGKL